MSRFPKPAALALAALLAAIQIARPERTNQPEARLSRQNVESLCAWSEAGRAAQGNEPVAAPPLEDRP